VLGNKTLQKWYPRCSFEPYLSTDDNDNIGACCPRKKNPNDPTEVMWCGYGPTSCGTNGISPNDVCLSNCDAHAECGKFAKIPGTTCPLNVCCSKHGFCGMKSDFCSDECQSNCEQPGSGRSNGNVQSRVIGYYEAWVHDKKCYGMVYSLTIPC
jgi:chitinase